MRFRRREGKESQEDLDAAAEAELDAEQGIVAPGPSGTGPYDESDVDLETHPGIDLGSLLVTPGEQMELCLEVDENSGEVAAAVLVGEEGAVELRAFAASRGGEAWDELRPRIAAEIARMGGTATAQDGSFGQELLCLVPVQTPDGQAATQPSRVVGHEGGAWLLRATLMGPPALDTDLAAPFEQAIRSVVVRRGRDARVPGSPLPLRLPPEARRVE